ncbi:MAG: DUF502 domain-containing protein [Halorientalis sp.]
MSVLTRLRNSFIAGVLVVAPLAVTVFVLQFIFAHLTGILNPIVRTTRLTSYTGNVELVAQLLAAVLLAGAITAVGYLASWSLGQRVFGGFERGIRLIPLVRTIYFGVRQVSESLSDPAAGYESVVLVEAPRSGLYSVGFVTNESPHAAREATDESLYNVFLPNSPNPTAGRLVLAPESDVYELDMPVRRGLRLLITTGLSVDDVDAEQLPDGVAPQSAEAER